MIRVADHGINLRHVTLAPLAALNIHWQLGAQALHVVTYTSPVSEPMVDGIVPLS